MVFGGEPEVANSMLQTVTLSTAMASLEDGMDRKKQEKEVMEYLNTVVLEVSARHSNWLLARKIIRVIMRRYDLFDTEDMPRGE